MKVIVQQRYDGHFMVKIEDIKDNDKVTELQLWLSATYIWNFSGTKHFMYQYELPSELREFLYSKQFDMTVHNLCHSFDVEIIKY